MTNRASGLLFNSRHHQFQPHQRPSIGAGHRDRFPDSFILPPLRTLRYPGASSQPSCIAALGRQYGTDKHCFAGQCEARKLLIIDMFWPPFVRKADMGDSRETRSGVRAQLSMQTGPAWTQCELCERAVSAAMPRLLAAFAHPNQQVSAAPGSLILLCRDCMALVRGEIDEDQWSRRTAH